MIPFVIGEPALARPPVELVGREEELDRLDAFLADRDALPAALIIEGSAGAGKTTLWRAAVDRARALGYRVLACRPAGAEIRLAYSAVSDLLEPHVSEALPGLPAPQRRALEIALLLGGDDGRPPDRRAIAAGFLNAVRALAREGPVILAIDDAQWLDDASADVIEYAVRRLQSDPIAILAAWRRGSPTVTVEGARADLNLDLGDRPPARLEVGPLSLGATNRLLRTRTALELSRRTLQRVHETAGGNPFYVLELARALGQGGATAGPGIEAGPGEPLPLSAGLSELLAERMSGFEPATRDALFVAAAVSGAGVALVEAAIGGPAEAVLEPALRGGVVRIEDRAVEFAHPLFAAAAYSTADPHDRRRWHARIAETSTDPEVAARHLALARPGPDAEVAAQLIDAARSARNRGAPAAAAELFIQALATLPRTADDDQASRLRRAELVAEVAPILEVTGEAARARSLLEASIAEIPAGPLRCDLLLLLAEFVESDEAAGQVQVRLIEQALEEAGDDPGRAAAALLDLEQVERSRDRSPDALPLARRALALAEEAGDERQLARAHVRTADLEVVLGLGGDPIERFQTALALGDRVPVDAENSARSMLAVCLIRAGRVDEARPYLATELARAVAEGDEASFCWISLFLSELEWFAGRWDAAAACAREALEVAEQAGLRMRVGGLRAIAALVESSRGDPERARALAREAIAILDEVDEVAYGNYARQMLAFLDLSLGDAAATRAVLDTYPPERLEGSKRLAFIGDGIEALVLLGDLERAATLIDQLARRGMQLTRPTLVATAARCRALLLGARGEPDAAISAAREAVEIHGSLPLPFEHARSLLVLGGVQRRAKRRRDARETLTAAIEAFDRLGAHLWSKRAEAERARVGGRSTIEGLTETEARVAALVAEGKSNKEVAAELFVTVRAVEANLSKVYAKLGVRSRTELARRI